MSDLLKWIQQADLVAFDMEKSKAAVETAKQSLETAKETFEQARKSFDEILTKADELGVSRGKARKLIEERTLALIASGLIEGETRPQVAKAPKSPRKAAKTPSEVEAPEMEIAEMEASEADIEGSVSMEII